MERPPKDRAVPILRGQLPIRVARFRERHDRDTAKERLAHFLLHSPAYAAARGQVAAGELASQHGLTWRIPPTSADDSTARRIGRGGLPFDRFLATRRVVVGGVMLDIGAGVGTTSIPRVILGDVEAVYAAEPEPANYAALVENVQVNGVEGYVLPDRVAISAEDGTAAFVLDKGIGRHRLAEAEPPPPPGREPRPRIDVQVQRLDTWVEGLGLDPKAITFIKTDCRGMDGAVLAGAPRLRAERHIVWQVEITSDTAAARRFQLADTLDLISTSFTHFIDLTRGTYQPMTIDKLVKSLAYFREAPESYTDLLLFNSED